MGAPKLPFEPLPQFQGNVLQDSAERAANKGKRIGILIVAYNALTTLSKVLKRITPEVWENVEEVVVADDASKDETYELAVGIQAMANMPKLRVLRRRQNLGYGGNQKAGYQYFMERGFDVVVMLHGDGQYAPELLSHLYRPLVDGEAAAVFGSRMMKDFGGPLKGGMPLYKYLGNRFLTEVQNRALGLKLTEFHSGYRAYNLHALRQIRLDNMTDDFHFDTEIIIKLQHQNFRVIEVPIPTFYGEEVCHVNGFRYAKDVLRAVYRYTATARAVQCFPEYAEYFVPYAMKRSLYSAHYYASRLVGTGQRVLEIRCGNGAFGAELVKSGNHVTGVDGRAAVPLASGYQNVFECDLEQGLPMTSQRYDRILLLDTVEHMRDASKLMRDCREALADRGRIVLSVPNFANLTVRLPLLFGHFRYADRGIVDWSHLRFFTRRLATDFVEANGLRVTGRRFTIMPIERLVPLKSDSGILRFLNHALRALTSIAPGLLAYEMLLVCEK